MIRVGLIGDYDATMPAHRAIPAALRMAADAGEHPLAVEWIPTENLLSGADVWHFDGLWCAAAGPDRGMQGALRAIRSAREDRLPFLATSGGFHHAVVEYTRNVLGWPDPPEAAGPHEGARPTQWPVECASVEVADFVRFRPGSRIAVAYRRDEAVEMCRYRHGLNPKLRFELAAGPLRIGAEDHSGQVRAVELDDHPFFIATQFQPELVALNGVLPPLVANFVRACAILAV